jgi:hypothetical protein
MGVVSVQDMTWTLCRWDVAFLFTISGGCDCQKAEETFPEGRNRDTYVMTTHICDTGYMGFQTFIQRIFKRLAQ